MVVTSCSTTEPPEGLVTPATVVDVGEGTVVGVGITCVVVGAVVGATWVVVGATVVGGNVVGVCVVVVGGGGLGLGLGLTVVVVAGTVVVVAGTVVVVVVSGGTSALT